MLQPRTNDKERVWIIYVKARSKTHTSRFYNRRGLKSRSDDICSLRRIEIIADRDLFTSYVSNVYYQSRIEHLEMDTRIFYVASAFGILADVKGVSD